MRLHSDKLTYRDMYDAARMAGVSFYRLEERGSRTRARAFDFIIEGSSNRRGNYNGYQAATWDEWGIVLGELFRRDPDAVVPHVYDSGEHFRWVTGGRFDTLTLDGQHKRHRWEPAGASVTGSYYASVCKCGAVVRRIAYGRTFAEIA